MSGHAGDVTPQEAWDLLADDPDAVLVDVRTTAEWAYVGLPDLDEVGKAPITIEWNTFPDGARNVAFGDHLAAEGIPVDAPLLFLCRSGARSTAAATLATEAGWTRAHNVTGGFEGDLDEARHRGTAGGWKATGLPWEQT